MNRLSELHQQIAQEEEKVVVLREQYRNEPDSSMRQSIEVKAKSIQKGIESLRQDAGIYERIEKAKQIAEDMRNKRKGVKTYVR